MLQYEKNNSIGLFLIYAGLWAINLLILIFSMPFLLFKKMREIFAKPSKKPQNNSAENPNSANYFPSQSLRS
jgi:hypothetical protein